MTTKEIKTKLLTWLKDNETCILECMEEEPESKYYEGLLTAYRNTMSKVEDIPIEGTVPIELKCGMRYRCLHDLHYIDTGELMFTKGHAYVVIRDSYSRNGLMDNDGTTRQHSDSLYILSTEYFEKMED